MQKTKIKGGVYKITCTANGKIYFGASTNMIKRWKEHIYNLENGFRTNKRLEGDFARYGKDAFVFEIVRECEPGEALLLEARLIQKYKTYEEKRGYNIRKGFVDFGF